MKNFSTIRCLSLIFCLQQKKSQDAQMRAAALSRELELTKATNEKQKSQISQLQELLANREQQHR